MDYRKYVILAVFLFLTVMLFGTDIEVFYNQARSNFDKVSTLQANISQTNEFVQSKTKLQSTGKLYYKPGYLLLDYTKPNIQKMIIKGNSVQIYDKNSRTLIKSVNKQGVSNPLQMVDKYWSTSRKELVSEDTTTIRIRLFPEKDANLKKLEVSFNQKTTMLTELIYWDNSGNKVKYRFLNIRTGGVIPSSKWSFIPPKGVKVIQQ